MRSGRAGWSWWGSPRVLLDGAHNPAATRALKQALQEEFPRERLVMVLGIMADKEIPKMMSNLVPSADFLFLCRPYGTCCLP